MKFDCREFLHNTYLLWLIQVRFENIFHRRLSSRQHNRLINLKMNKVTFFRFLIWLKFKSEVINYIDLKTLQLFFNWSENIRIAYRKLDRRPLFEGRFTNLYFLSFNILNSLNILFGHYEIVKPLRETYWYFS